MSSLIEWGDIDFGTTRTLHQVPLPLASLLKVGSKGAERNGRVGDEEITFNHQKGIRN
jgi:hypothetical protein